MSAAAFIFGLCMIVVNSTSGPVQMHGCVYDGNWPQGQSKDGCKVYGSWETKVDDLVFTVEPGWPPTVVYDVMQYDDETNPYYRNWMTPKDVTVHWRDPCPVSLAEFK